jgi:hypothetical protein
VFERVTLVRVGPFIHVERSCRANVRQIRIGSKHAMISP